MDSNQAPKHSKSNPRRNKFMSWIHVPVNGWAKEAKRWAKKLNEKENRGSRICYLVEKEFKAIDIKVFQEKK